MKLQLHPRFTSELMQMIANEKGEKFVSVLQRRPRMLLLPVLPIFVYHITLIVIWSNFRVHRPKLANRPNRCSWRSLWKKEIYPITFVTNSVRYSVATFSMGSPTFQTVSMSIHPRDNLCFLPHFILPKTKITTRSNAISKKKWKQIDGRCNSLSSPFNITA